MMQTLNPTLVTKGFTLKTYEDVLCAKVLLYGTGLKVQPTTPEIYMQSNYETCRA